MNFQSIRNDFNQQVKEQTEALEAEQMRAHLAEELERQDRLHSKTRYTHYKRRQPNIHVLLMAVNLQLQPCCENELNMKVAEIKLNDSPAVFTYIQFVF